MISNDRDLILVRALGCQWLGDKTSNYCGSRDLVDGAVYCKEHHPQMYQKGTALRKRKKDIRIANQVWDWENTFNEVVAELEEEGVL